MADTKITALAAITTVDPAADVLPIVDVSDTSMAASGTTKKITTNQILGSSGIATLASATITGAATAANLVVTGSTIPANGVYLPSANNLGFAYNSTLGMTLNSTGLGVGVTPSAWGSNNKALQVGGGTASVSSTGAGSTASRFAHGAYFDNTNWLYQYTGVGPALYQVTGANAGSTHAWYIAPGGTAGNAITFTQAMTLDASGNLIVGNTAAPNVGATGGVVNVPNSGNSYTLIGHTNGSASGSTYAYFFYNSSTVGSITQNGTTGVLYNISSDYRLKESVAPLSGGLARVNALKPSIYKWKSDGSAGEGFLAHELAEVVPFAVTGEKDAVNEDGSIKSQGIDMSRVVPILVAAIQELAAEVNALKNA